MHYGTSLSNVDWLHGSAESFLTLSNLFVVLGLREALRKANDVQETSSNLGSDTEKETSSSYLGHFRSRIKATEMLIWCCLVISVTTAPPVVFNESMETFCVLY